jgi:hypothetical protein
MTKEKKKPRKKARAKPPAKVLVLRTCDANMCGYAGFKWPEKGPVEAPTKWWGKGEPPDDLRLGWIKGIECGGGLHGLLWGEGAGDYLNWDTSAKWLVVEVDPADIEESMGKVRFRFGNVVHCGDRLSATEYVRINGGAGRAISGGTATAGDSGTATAGYRGTATAGYRGTATAGDRGTATAGDRGTATAGYRGTATAGDRGTATAGDSGTATAGDSGTATAGDSGTATAGYSGTATAGYSGTATAGDSGTATAGYRGTATAGDRGTATAGDSGTATAGDSGTATAGDSGTATAGDSGTVCIRYWDAKADRYRLAIGYVGENGIQPNVKYRLENGTFTEVKQ